MPDPSFVNTFVKPQLETTKPVPFKLRIDSRGQEKLQKLDEKVGVDTFCEYSF